MASTRQQRIRMPSRPMNDRAGRRFSPVKPPKGPMARREAAVREKPAPARRLDYCGDRSAHGSRFASAAGRSQPRRKKKIGRKIITIAALVWLGFWAWDQLVPRVGSIFTNIDKPTVNTNTAAVPDPATTSPDAAAQPDTGTTPVSTTVARHTPVLIDPGASEDPLADPPVNALVDPLDADGAFALPIPRPATVPAQAGMFTKARLWVDSVVGRTLAVREVRIFGAHALPADSLRAELNSLNGVPLLKLDLPRLARYVEQHPRIREARIGRQLPGTLTVDIRERREIALLINGGRIYGLDADGIILPPPEPGWPLDLPLIVGYDKPVAPGDQVRSSAIREAIRWAAEARNMPRVQGWMSEVCLANGHLDCLIGEDGRKLVPGRHNIVAQLATLDAYLATGTDGAAGQTIDLTFPGFLIVRGG